MAASVGALAACVIRYTRGGLHASVCGSLAVKGPELFVTSRSLCSGEGKAHKGTRGQENVAPAPTEQVAKATAKDWIDGSDERGKPTPESDSTPARNPNTPHATDPSLDPNIHATTQYPPEQHQELIQRQSDQGSSQSGQRAPESDTQGEANQQQREGSPPRAVREKQFVDSGQKRVDPSSINESRESTTPNYKEGSTLRDPHLQAGG